EMRLHKLKELWMCWVNNYRLASIHQKLKQLDEWLRNRLRYCIWSRNHSSIREKKLERKRNLIRLGVKQRQAYTWSSGMYCPALNAGGGWAVAQSPSLGTTITLSRLRKKGYQSMTDHYLKFKPEIQ